MRLSFFFDPINIRYATDTSNIQVWVLHNLVRYVFVPLEGPLITSNGHVTLSSYPVEDAFL